MKALELADSKYYVIDCSGNETHKYVDDDCGLVDLRVNAASFDTEKEAEEFAAKVDPKREWAVVESGEWCQ